MTKFAGWMGGDVFADEALSLLQIMTANEVNLKPRLGRGFALVAPDSGSIHKDECILLAINNLNKSPGLENWLTSYRQQGADFIGRQTELLAIVLIDVTRQRLILATDPIGLSQIYFARTQNGVVFGSSADYVIRHPQVSNEISLQSVYDYVYFHHCPSPNTIYRQVQKLEGGHCLVFQDGQISIKRYWQPEFKEHLSGSLQEAGMELQQKLVESVRSMADTEENTGAFLSGGLDSSSVAGALAKVFPGKAKTFSMGFPVEGYNEIEYANIAVKHFNTRQHEYYVTPEDTVNAVAAIAQFYDEPFGNSSALAAYYCAKLAKENGVNRLLAGDGGDEIFAGNDRYAKQMLFDYYHRLPGFVQTTFEAGLSHLPPAIADLKLPFKVKRYIEQANAPMPDRLQDYNFLHRHDVRDIFSGDFLAEVDTAQPLGLLRASYQTPENASTLNRMLYMDWKTTLHDNDLVKVNRMCELVGVEVGYPLLDQPIVDLSCRIPSQMKLKGQKLRWFYKQAMANFLPEAIINKSKHGFGLPFGIWLKDHQPLKTLAYDAIHDLKKRDYFRPQFLDHAIDMHQSIHAAYYGELIWVLMMLELWFVGKGR